MRAARIEARRGAHLQDGRHLRRRVRGGHAVPLLDLRGHRRGRRLRPAQGRHPRLGPEPHRAGHRVRLLLRPRQLRPARRRLRDDHGQLQSGDGVDRLRHLRPALLRAAHPRGRHERHRGREAGGRDRLPRRPDPAEALGHPAARARGRHVARSRSTPPRTARSGAPCAPGSRSPSPPAAPRPRSRPPSPSPRASGTRSLVRPSYVLGGRAMEIVYDDDGLARAMAELAGFGSLGKEGGLSAERPVLVDRFLEDATEVDVDAIRDAGGDFLIGGIMEHVEEAGVHSGDSACVIPPYSLSAETMAVLGDYTRRIADALGRDRAHQRPVRGEERPGLRDRGQPPRQPHGAVRGQGHRRAARQGGQPGDARRHARRAAGREAAHRAGGRRPRGGEGGGAAVQPLPRGRRPARARRCARPARSWASTSPSAWPSPRASWRRAPRCPTSGTVFLSLADRDKTTGVRAAAAVPRARLHHRGHLGHRRPPAGQRRRGGHGGGQDR